MYLSCLLIDVGTNPDRPRPGRLWLRNLYRVHQRLCMGFPSASRRADDPHFLKPFDPGDFASAQVHLPRGEGNGFLFRVDSGSRGSVPILVQSASKPDWDYAFHNAGHILRCFEVKQFSPAFSPGQTLRFRLLANPTKRLREASRGPDGRPVEKECVGSRVPVPNAMLEDWLARRAEPAGFRVARLASVQPGFVYANKTREPAKGQRMRSVRYEGLLEVTDPASFGHTLIKGIGPAKAFGFGLLSVAPVRSAGGGRARGSACAP